MEDHKKIKKMVKEQNSILEENDEPLSFTQSGQEENVRKIISKLKFISLIKSGDKIDTKNMIIRKNEIVDILWRILSRESRSDTFNFLKNTIDDAINMIYYYRDKLTPFDKQISELIIKNLNESKKGLENISNTYSNDINFVCNINSLLETMNVKLNGL
jgi:hypothetical protein